MNRIALFVKSSICAALFCGLFGSLIAFVPHIATRVEFGDWEFYHDQDEVLYRMIAKPAIDGSWQMRDVFVQADRKLTTNYSWMQFVPTSHLATYLGFDAMSLGQFWRLLGGFGAGIAFYIVFGSIQMSSANRVLISVLCTLLALSEAGFGAGRVLVENVHLLYYIFQSRTPKGEATSFTLYRVITPLWNLPVSMVAAALLSPCVLKRHPARSYYAILATALTVMLYFFQWTALVSGSGLCFACFLVWDQCNKTEYRRATLIAIGTLGLGLVIGLPQILSNANTFSTPEMKPILDRVGRGQHIPWGDPSRWNNVMNRWAWIKIIVAFLIAIRLKHRGLILFSSIGTMGYLLSISVFLTGIEFENWHWLYVINPFLAVVIYTGLIQKLINRKKNAIAWLIVIASMTSGIYIRYHEALIAPDALAMRRWVEGVKPMREIVGKSQDDGKNCIAGEQASRILSLSIPGGRILFHDPHSAHTSLMSDQEVHERYILNYWLMGGTRADLANRPENKIFKMYIFAGTRPEWDRNQVRLTQLAVFDQLESDNGKKLINRFQPEWLLLSNDSDRTAPERGGRWEFVITSDYYTLWRRSD